MKQEKFKENLKVLLKAKRKALYKSNGFWEPNSDDTLEARMYSSANKSVNVLTNKEDVNLKISKA